MEAGSSDWRSVTLVDLVVEVLGPSTSHHDRTSKRRLYQDNGVGTLWLVDTDRRQVEVWTPDARVPMIETARVTWHPVGVPEPLVIEIAEFFRADERLTARTAAAPPSPHRRTSSPAAG